MHLTSSVLVKSDLERAWAFLSNERNAPRWTAPSGMTQEFRVTHEIAIALRWRWAILVPVLALFNRRALGADLDSLRRAIDEGHDLTAEGTS